MTNAIVSREIRIRCLMYPDTHLIWGDTLMYPESGAHEFYIVGENRTYIDRFSLDGGPPFEM